MRSEEVDGEKMEMVKLSYQDFPLWRRYDDVEVEIGPAAKEFPQLSERSLWEELWAPEPVVEENKTVTRSPCGSYFEYGATRWLDSDEYQKKFPKGWSNVQASKTTGHVVMMPARIR